jgi:hypothetical protein
MGFAIITNLLSKGVLMKDLIKLIDIICDVYDNAAFIPSGGVTHCNEAAQTILHAFGCKDFDEMMADDIFVFLKKSPDWSEIPVDRVQEISNQGSVVFAIATSQMLGQDHGHICICRPGIPKNSGKWGMVPCVMNIGAECFIGRAKRGPLTNMPCGINEAFIPMPKFYLWRLSL